MKLLCLSNGHGEDGIAVRILTSLRRIAPRVSLEALPLVGEGIAYEKALISRVGPRQALPSGGFVYMDGRELARDVKSGLVQLTLAQVKAIRSSVRAAPTQPFVFAVGDILPLLMARLSGAPFGFIGTAKSDYFLRDEQGPLPQRPWFEGWSGSVYLPWERWLMSNRHCQVAFVRDQMTADTLQSFGIPACYAGNPMMDDLIPDPAKLKRLTTQLPEPVALTLVLLPGSRMPEALDNWGRILRAADSILACYPDKPVTLLTAITSSLSLFAFDEVLTEAGWQLLTQTPYPTYQKGKGTLRLTQDAYAEALHLCEGVIAMAGTATEQAVGLGKPAFTFSGKGPQFTSSFADVQSRLLGPSVVLLPQPEDVGAALQTCFQDPNRLRHMHENGRHRMGGPGAAERIAQILWQQMQASTGE